MNTRDYKRCAKMLRNNVRRLYGYGHASAWSMLTPQIRSAVVRSAALSVLHGRADDDRGVVISDADITGLLREVTAVFGDEIE